MVRPLNSSYHRDLGALNRMRSRLAQDGVMPTEIKEPLVEGLDLVLTVVSVIHKDPDIARDALCRCFDRLHGLMTAARGFSTQPNGQPHKNGNGQPNGSNGHVNGRGEVK